MSAKDHLSQSKTATKGTQREAKAFRSNPNRSYDPPPMPEMDEIEDTIRPKGAFKGKLFVKVLELLENGLTYAQIGQKLHVSRQTLYRWRDDPECYEACEKAIDSSIENAAIQAVQEARLIVVPGVKGYQLGMLHYYESGRLMEVARMRLRTWRPRLDEGEGIRILDYGIGDVIKKYALPGDQDGQGEGAKKVARGKQKLSSRK